jgi:antitoxin YefM
MTTITVSSARANLYNIIDETAKSHIPVHITGKRSNAVLIAEEDWESIEETLYLMSIPGMRDSIKKGLDSDLAQCDEELKW